MIGNSGLSIDQSRTQMAIWAILAAPLMMSHHLKYTAQEMKQILLNKYEMFSLETQLCIYIVKYSIL